MKSKLWNVLTLMLLVCLVLTLAACGSKDGGEGDGGDTPPTHTCTHRDADDNGKCDKCGVDFTDGNEPCAHTAGIPVRENEVAATCTVGGSYDEVVYCSVEGCGAELSRTAKSITAPGHTPAAPVVENNKAANCFTGGSYDEVVYCSVLGCGAEILREEKTVPATGEHIPAAAVRENEVAATCTVNGSYDEVVYCTVAGCGAEISRTEKTIPIKHSYVDKICSICGDVKPSEGLVFTSNGDGTCYVSGIGTCTDTDIVIPKISPEKCTVTGIGENAFRSNPNITRVTILDSVTSIGYHAFDDCKNLVSVIFGDDSQLTNIGDHAFYGCTSLADITIPDSVTSIGDHAFDSCYSLTSVTIQKNVTRIGNDAFQYCHKLVEVINKSSLIITKGSSDNGDIGRYALEIHSGESKIDNVDGYLFYIYDGVNYLLGYVGDDKDLILPNNYKGENYSIYGWAFCYRSDLTSVTIPNSVTSIGNSAFYYCTGLTSIDIQNSVTSIGNYAFYNCTGLTSITIPNSVASIGERAFNSCYNLTSVTIGSGVTSIGKYAFDFCYKLVEVINKSSLNIIKGSSDNAYVAYYAIEVHRGESKIVNKDGYLFYTHNGVNYLVNYIGDDTGLTLPDNYNGEIYRIYNHAFHDNDNITSAIIPDSVTSIGSRAFLSCGNLTSVTIGSGVTSIGVYAFEYCLKLLEVINKSSLDITRESSNNGYIAYYALRVHTGESEIVNKDGYLFITLGRVNYLLGYTGEDIALTLPENYNGENYVIYQYAFHNNDDITSLTIPDSVTIIQNYAFDGCHSVTTINYRGSEAEWNAVSKGSSWAPDAGFYTIVYNYDGE